ncbi:MAG TPA: hypothetical protein VIH42_15490 [Thermoguttaceae bacterium]
MANSEEMRTDPLWEFGSFGCTGCHKKNLMNLRKSDELNGTRLAFAQGGCDGFKLVHLTPPIKIIQHGKIAEAKWSSKFKPLKYKKAPLLINKNGETDFPLLKHFIRSTNWHSWVTKFSSKFRSRRKPLDIKIANQIIKVFNEVISDSRDIFASKYFDTLDKAPPKVDKNRRHTYFELIKRAENDKL